MQDTAEKNLVTLSGLHRATGLSRERLRALMDEPGFPIHERGGVAGSGSGQRIWKFDLDAVLAFLDQREEQEAFAPVMAEDDPRHGWAKARAENLKAKLVAAKRGLISYEGARRLWSETVPVLYRAYMSKADEVAENVASNFPEARNHNLKKLLRDEIKNAFAEIKQRKSVLPEPPIPVDGIEFGTPPENAEVASRLHPSDPRRLVAELQAERLRIKTAIETRNLISADEFFFAYKDQLVKVRQAVWHCPARIMHPIFMALDNERKWIFRDAFRNEIRGLLEHGAAEVARLNEKRKERKEQLEESESETF